MPAPGSDSNPEQIVGKRQGREDPEAVGYLFCLAGEGFEQGPGKEACCHSYAQVVGEAHENDCEECRGEFGHVAEVQVGYGFQHEHSHHYENGAVGAGGYRGEYGGEEQREQEKGCGYHRGEA